MSKSGIRPLSKLWQSFKRAESLTRGQVRSVSHFRIVEHVARCQHTRDRPAGAERGHENELKLHVKQYIPYANRDPKPGDVTIIGAQANGFPKEVYEPFWEDLQKSLKSRGRDIRSIWIADIASQGQSGILNEELLGPDASWLDHGRDLLYLINQFQDDIPHPIVGVGHSVGGSHLAYLSLLHPRLMQSLVLVDPIMQRDLSLHKALTQLSTTRRDIWPSRKAAAEKFRSSGFYSKWDSRVLEKWIEYGLRDLPTEKYPELPEGGEVDMADPPVTLSTTVAQEIYYYLRAYYHDPRLLQGENLLQGVAPEDRDGSAFYRPESSLLHRRLPEIEPSVLYVFGDKSEASPAEFRDDKVSRTGTGVGGSGGAALRRVEEAVLDSGHLVAMEHPTECAEASASFVGKELERWEARERERDAVWASLKREERVDVNDLWKRHLGVSEE